MRLRRYEVISAWGFLLVVVLNGIALICHYLGLL